MPRPKERYEQMKKLIEAEKSSKVELLYKVYDIILNGPQDYQLVELSYNPTQGVSKVEVIEKNIFSLALAKVKRDNKNVEAFIDKQRKGYI